MMRMMRMMTTNNGTPTLTKPAANGTLHTVPVVQWHGTSRNGGAATI